MNDHLNYFMTALHFVLQMSRYERKPHVSHKNVCTNKYQELLGTEKFLPNMHVRASEAWLSQAAACDGLIYSVNYNGQNSGMQGYVLPLFED